MANPPKTKGTGFENHVLETYLLPLWSGAKRAAPSGILDFGDFINVGGILIEAKARETWRLPAWIRDIYTKIARAGHRRPYPWLLFFKQDKRGPLNEDYVAQPAWLWLETQSELARLREVARNA